MNFYKSTTNPKYTNTFSVVVNKNAQIPSRSGIKPDISANSTYTLDTTASSATIQLQQTKKVIGNIYWYVSSVNNIPIVSIPGISISNTGLITIDKGYSFLNKLIYVLVQNDIQKSVIYDFTSKAITLNVTSTPSLSPPLITSGNSIYSNFTTQVRQNTINTGSLTWKYGLTSAFPPVTSYGGVTISNTTGLITVQKNISLVLLSIYVFVQNPAQVLNSAYTSINFNLDIKGYETPIILAPTYKPFYNFMLISSRIADKPSVNANVGILSWSINKTPIFTTATSFTGGTPSTTISIDGNGYITTGNSASVIDQVVYVWARNPAIGSTSYRITTYNYDIPVITPIGTQNITYDVQTIVPTVTGQNNNNPGILTWSISNTPNFTTSTSFIVTTNSVTVTASINSSGRVSVNVDNNYNLLVYIWARNSEGNYGSTNFLLRCTALPPFDINTATWNMKASTLASGGVTTWGPFTQTNATYKPTCFTTGGFGNGAYVRFVNASQNYMYLLATSYTCTTGYFIAFLVKINGWYVYNRIIGGQPAGGAIGDAYSIWVVFDNGLTGTSAFNYNLYFNGYGGQLQAGGYTITLNASTWYILTYNYTNSTNTTNMTTYAANFGGTATSVGTETAVGGDPYGVLPSWDYVLGGYQQAVQVGPTQPPDYSFSPDMDIARCVMFTRSLQQFEINSVVTTLNSGG